MRSAQSIDAAGRDRLDDPVDVYRPTARVRPETHVDLVSVEELGHGARYVTQQGPELCCFGRVEVPDVDDVAPGLDYERSDARRADTVLDDPAAPLMDPPARQRHATRGQVADETAFHLAHPAARPFVRGPGMTCKSCQSVAQSEAVARCASTTCISAPRPGQGRSFGNFCRLVLRLSALTS